MMVFSPQLLRALRHRLRFTGIVYPNPASTVAYTMIDSRADNTDATISLYDMTGKVVASKLVSLHAGRQIIPLDVAAVAPGIYFVHLYENGTASTRKLVIVR